MSIAQLTKKCGAWLVAKPLHSGVTALFISLLFLVPIPGCDLIVSAILALVTFANGFLAGLAVIGWMIIPFVAQLVLRQFGITFEIEIGLLVFCLLIFTVALLYRSMRNWVTVFWCVASFGVLLLSVIHIYIPNLADYWHGFFHAQMDLLQKNGILPQTAQLRDGIDLLMPWMSGILLTGLMFFVLIYTLIGQRWHAAVANVDHGAVKNIRLGLSAWLAVIVIAAGYFMHLPDIESYVLIVSLPAMLVGLLIWNSAARGNTPVLIVLIISYVALLFFMPWVALFWVLTGLLDTFFDMRALLARAAGKSKPVKSITKGE